LRIDPSRELRRLSAAQWLIRGLLVAGLLALVWWAAWVFDPRNFGGLPAPFAVLVAAQLLDLFAVLGFWHAIWPRRRPRPPWGTVRGRSAILVLAREEPVQVVEQTVGAVLAVRRRQRVFLADPLQRPELGWLAGWYGVRRLSPGMEELNGIASARFLAVIHAGQVPYPEFLERLLPHFADRRLALVQAWYSRDGHRSGARDAVLRGRDAMDRAACLGSNYVLRRSALPSIGGFGATATSPAGALRMAAALRTEQWQTRYVSERIAETVGRSGPRPGLADAWRRTAAQLAFGRRRRGGPVGGRLSDAWLALRVPALVGLPVSAVVLAAYATLEPLGWLANLALHLAPYLGLRLVVRAVVAVRRPRRVPASEAVGLQPELHMGWKVLSAPTREPMPPVTALPPEPGPVPAAAEAMPGRRLRTLHPLVAVAAAWIVTAGAIGAVTLAVIRSNPPQPPAALHGGSTPPYSYYAPVQPPGGPQPGR